MAPASGKAVSTEEHRDSLPSELDLEGYVGITTFPDPARRRGVGAMWLVAAAIAAAVLATNPVDGVLVNRGLIPFAIGAALIGVYHLAAGHRLGVRETDALVVASKEVGFPVGHASAQLGFRGLLSRPTWRILLYSADNPPTKRGMVLVDGKSGSVLGEFVEDNPEDPSDLDQRRLKLPSFKELGEQPKVASRTSWRRRAWPCRRRWVGRCRSGRARRGRCRGRR